MHIWGLESPSNTVLCCLGESLKQKYRMYPFSLSASPEHPIKFVLWSQRSFEDDSKFDNINLTQNDINIAKTSPVVSALPNKN